MSTSDIVMLTDEVGDDGISLSAMMGSLINDGQVRKRMKFTTQGKNILFIFLFHFTSLFKFLMILMHQ
jgi:hypothetical protein